ncbi:MAG: hypothetical protein HFI93_03550 [Lachnospiraceae bacterium]|nr:hypothetical protein [Lachnospiraceae bacterium]
MFLCIVAWGAGRSLAEKNQGSHGQGENPDGNQGHIETVNGDPAIHVIRIKKKQRDPCGRKKPPFAKEWERIFFPKCPVTDYEVNQHHQIFEEDGGKQESADIGVCVRSGAGHPPDFGFCHDPERISLGTGDDDVAEEEKFGQKQNQI